MSRSISPAALGFGDVKLLGLLGMVLGTFGWGALLAGIFLGLLFGALASLLLVAARRGHVAPAAALGQDDRSAGIQGESGEVE